MLRPKSGHWNSAARCPLCAKSGHRWAIRLAHRPPRGELLAPSSQDFSQFCYLGAFRTSWALYWQIPWLGAAEDLINIGGALPVLVGIHNSVRHEAARIHEEAVGVNRR